MVPRALAERALLDFFCHLRRKFPFAMAVWFPDIFGIERIVFDGHGFSEVRWR